MDDKELLVADMRKKFGDSSIFILGKDEPLFDIKVRSSGSILLDMALGGGYPHGRLIEFVGAEKAGKTVLLNMTIAEAQKTEPDKQCAIIDLEQSYNPEWAKVLGVNIDELIFMQPDTYAERVFEMLEYMLKTEKFSIIGLDSVAGLVPRSEFEETDWAKESRVGGISKIMSKAIGKIVNTGILQKSGTTLIFINQIRDKIGGFSPYGTPTDTLGGHSLKHACTQICDVSIGEFFIKQEGGNRKYLGQQIKVKVSKNKIAPPMRVATVDLYYDKGIDKLTETILVAKELGILTGSNWLKLVDINTGEVMTDDEGNEIKWNGVNKAREALVEDVQNNGELYNIINQEIQDMIRK